MSIQGGAIQRPVEPATGALSRRQLIDHLAKVGAGALAVAMGGGGIDVSGQRKSRSAISGIRVA